jgi:hypothetical protein
MTSQDLTSLHPFVAWNLQLLRHYFSPSSQGAEVWLDTTPDELDAISPELGGETGLLSAVRDGPPWHTIGNGRAYFASGVSADLVERARGLREQRRAQPKPTGYVNPEALDPTYQGASAPNYLPILAAMVRARAAQEESGFYAEFARSLALPADWYGMRDLEPLWKDLSAWSKDASGRYGNFEYRRLGQQRWVSIPRAQSIFSRRDLAQIQRIFAAAGVTPGLTPPPQMIETVRRIASNSAYLSHDLQHAMLDENFVEPITSRLRMLIEDWDGRVDSDAGSSRILQAEARSETLQVALRLSAGNELPWQVEWQVPALLNEGSALLTSEGGTWIAHFSGNEPTRALPSAHQIDSGITESIAVELLARSASSTVPFGLTPRVDDDQIDGARERRLVLSRRAIRYFKASSRIGEDSEFSLVERDLPGFGEAYLLVAPERVEQVRNTFSAFRVPLRSSPAEGLPLNWELFYVADCSLLAEFRYSLPDGEPQERARPRTVRFVGGLPLARFGQRLFAAYDLPDVELDAPDGATITAVGLVLREITASPPTFLPTGLSSSRPVRRFTVSQTSTAQRVFHLQANHRGDPLGTATLRLDSDGGISATEVRSFSLDALGHGQRDDLGLRGVLPGFALGPLSGVTRIEVRRAGSLCSVTRLDVTSGLASAKFLDALAKAGSFAFGRAREILARLIVRSFEREVNDGPMILRELQLRGMLEIESDTKGRWIRVHSTEPSIYTIPVRSGTNEVVAGIGGTLLLAQWNELAGRLGAVAQLLEDDVPNSILPVFRITAADTSTIAEIAVRSGFRFVQFPALHVARWARDLSGVRTDLTRTGVVSVGSNLLQCERFGNLSGCYSNSLAIPSVGEDFSHVLFRMLDPDTERHRLHVLAFRDAEAHPRYRYLPDARWGVWIALLAGAEFAKSRFEVGDALPWPLPYDVREGTVWLPARTRLPLILERALILCSGAPPKELPVRQAPGREKLVMEHVGGLDEIGTVSRVYEQFLPHDPRYAIWLGYRWVPESIAEAIAFRVAGAVSRMNA